jgi:hypothetical protein
MTREIGAEDEYSSQSRFIPRLEEDIRAGGDPAPVLEAYEETV